MERVKILYDKLEHLANKKEEEETKREEIRKKEEEETKREEIRKKEEEETKREEIRKKEETKRKIEEEKTKRKIEEEKTKRIIEVERTARARIESASRSKSDSASTIAALHVVHQMMDRMRNIIPQESGDRRTLPQASTPVPSELSKLFENVPKIDKEVKLQGYASKQLKKFKDPRILNPCVDTHKNFFLKDESTKPEKSDFTDLLARMAGRRELSSARAPDFKIAEEDIPYQIGLVGLMELKVKISPKTNDVEQAMDYCRILLGLQPFRTCTFCLLTDLRIVKILEVTRTQAFIHNGKFIDDGLPLLWYLMTTPNEKIFNDIPRIIFPNISYSYVKALGEGATSTVYQVKLTDPSWKHIEKDGVIKAYFDNFSYLMENEKQKLLDLADYGSGIPKFIAQGNPPSILMTPCGQPIKKLKARDCEKIVKILKYAHSKNIVHRDLRQANILIFKNSVVINDWGFAVESEVNAVYQGTIKTASDRILALLANGYNYFPCFPSDDLCSFVKLFILSLGGVVPLSNNPQECLTYWEQYWDGYKGTLLRNAIEAANACKYDEVAATLCSLMYDLEYTTHFNTHV
ncbi:hypothetical protein K7432_014341 [Basidiobolus ranarum]